MAKPLTSAQIRAARALLRWRAEDLAVQSNVGVATIRRAELSEKETSLTAANDSAVRRTLESAGVWSSSTKTGAALEYASASIQLYSFINRHSLSVIPGAEGHSVRPA